MPFRQLLTPGQQAQLRRHLPYLTFGILLAVLSYPAWLHAGVPGTDDLTNLNIPQRQLLRWFYRQDLWPLWNPFDFGGQPFLAAGQSGPLYLPNVLFVVFPIAIGLKLSYIFHIILCTVGAYFAAWQLSRSRLGSLVGAVALADSGFLIGHQVHTQMFDAFCWLPLIFCLTVRLLHTPSRRLVAGASLAVGGEVFAGHPQITFFVCLFLTVFVGLTWLWQPALRTLARAGVALLPMAGGSLVAAAQLWPTLQLVAYSDRTTVDPTFLLQGSMPPIGLAQLLMPYLAGGGYTGQPLTFDSLESMFIWPTFWELTCYVGLATVVLAVAASVSRMRQDPAVRSITVIGTLAVLLAVGQNTFFAAILTHVPGFDLFRIPARYIGILDFCIAMLAAVGIGHLRHHANASRFVAASALTAAAGVPGILAIRLFSRAAQAPLSAFLVPMGLCLVVVLVCLIPEKHRRTWVAGFISCLALADVVSHAVALSPFVDWSEDPLHAPSPVAQYLLSHRSGMDWPRIASIGWTPDASLQLDRNSAYLLPSLNGYDSLVPVWYVQNVDLTRETATFMSQPRELADALGVKYLVTDFASNQAIVQETNGIQAWQTTIDQLPPTVGDIQVDLNNKRPIQTNYGPLFSITLQSGSHALTEQVVGWPASAYLVPLPKGWPRRQPTQVTLQNQAWSGTYVIDDIRLGNKTVSVDRTFAPKGWDPVFQDATATVWKNPDPLVRAWLTYNQNAPLVHAPGTVTETLDQPLEQHWHVTARHAGILMLSQTYDPHWRASIDGRAVPVEQIDGMLTGIPITPGVHRVVLQYKSAAFQNGLAVSIISGLCAFALLL